jgi:hypothetical protein
MILLVTPNVAIWNNTKLIYLLACLGGVFLALSAIYAVGAVRLVCSFASLG